MVSVVAFEVIQVLQVVSIFNRRFISTTDLFWSFGSWPAGHRLSRPPYESWTLSWRWRGLRIQQKWCRCCRVWALKTRTWTSLKKLVDACKSFCFVTRWRVKFGRSTMGIWCAQIISVQERIMEHAMNFMNRGIEKSPAEERTQFRKDREKFKAHHRTNVLIHKPSAALKLKIPWVKHSKRTSFGSGNKLGSLMPFFFSFVWDWIRN